MRSICYASNAARRFQPSCTKWPTRMRRSYARIAGRAATVILRRPPSLWRGRDPLEGLFSGLVSDRLDRYALPSSVDSGPPKHSLDGAPSRAVATTSSVWQQHVLTPISGTASFLVPGASNTHENEYEQ